MNQNSNDLCWKASLLSSDYLVLFPVLFPRGSVNCFCKVTVIFNSIYFLHFTQFKTADSAIYFLFFSLLLSQLSVVQKQMTPKPSHLKQLLSWFWGLSGLRWFSAVMAGGQSWGLRHLSVSGSSAGAVGQNACLWPPSWFGFLNSWVAWMSPRHQAEAGWLFMTYPQKFRDRISDAQITGLCRSEERKPVSCFSRNMREILWPSGKIHWLFALSYEGCPHFSRLCQHSMEWVPSGLLISSSLRFPP